MNEERLIDIESRLAHQDQLLHELNDAVTSQQASILELNALCRSLIERLRALAEVLPGADAGDEVPPHY